MTDSTAGPLLSTESIEVIVISSRDCIDHLAGRIERAYRRRYPDWRCIGVSPGVWDSAAFSLLEVANDSAKIPADPELYVAVQATGENSPDPWTELTQKRSRARYISVLRRIISQLRRELRDELRLARRRLLRGMSLDEILLKADGRISPLSCYILSYRAGRFDLCSQHRAAAESQHRSCPLYRQASRTLLPHHDYPGYEPIAAPYRSGREIMQFSLN